MLELKGAKDSVAPYAVILGYLGLLESQKMSRAEAFLDAYIRLVDTDSPRANLLKYVHRDLNEKQLLSLATDDEALTDAHALIGQMYIRAGNCESAAPHLEWVKMKGDKMLLSFDWAIANLDRIARTCPSK